MAQTEAAEEGPEEKAAAHKPLQIAIHAVTGLVLVRDLVRLDAADSKLICELHGLYDEDLSARRIPEHYRFMPPRRLASRLGNIHLPTLRKRINRFRDTVNNAHIAKRGRPLPNDAIIENRPWKGYRLNPSVRFVAIEEIGHRLGSQVAPPTSQLPQRAPDSLGE